MSNSDGLPRHVLPEVGDILIIKRPVDMVGWTVRGNFSWKIYTGGDIDDDVFVIRQSDW